MKSASGVLPEAAHAWVRAAFGSAAQGLSFSPLPGGMSAQVDRVRVRLRHGEERAVLKRFVDRAWLAREPDLVSREVLALQTVAELDVPAPRLIAFDEVGSHCDVPAILMSDLGGAVELPEPPARRWLERLAAPLPVLHAAHRLPDTFSAYHAYTPPERFEIPTWSRRPAAWQRAFDRLTGEPPDDAPTFIHRDYHPCNVLWVGGALAGVVDWTMACRGPRGVDLAHCRANLVSLSGREAADAFAAGYEAQTGWRHDPYWDVRCLVDFLPVDEVYPGWLALGRSDLVLASIRERIDDWIERLVATLGGD